MRETTKLETNVRTIISPCRTGFNDADVTYLNRRTDTRKTQIFSSEEIIDNPEQEHYYCVSCKGKLDADVDMCSMCRVL